MGIKQGGLGQNTFGGNPDYEQPSEEFQNLFWLELSSNELTQHPILERAGKLNSNVCLLVTIINPNPFDNRLTAELSVKRNNRDEHA